MAEKLLSNELTLKPEGTVALADVPPDGVELPQAAATMAIPPIAANIVSDLSFLNYSPP